ncbi:MAG: hypothetical protein ACREA8_07440 [Nitrosotalea sp.]
MQKYFIFIILALLLIAPMAFQSVHASTGKWYPGIGLKQGDYYKYSLGWVQWHNGAPVELDFWVKNQTSSGLNLEMVAHDGDIIEKGIVTIGNITPDPTSFDANVADYANYFKRTLVWLEAFATQVNPIDPLTPVYGRAGLFGEVTIGSVGMRTVTVPAGTFQTSAVYFRDSGVDSYIWIDPTLPFPVKAQVYAIKTSGAPTIGYEYDLLEHGNSQQPPAFLNVQSTDILSSNTSCPVPDFATDFIHSSQTTNTNSVTVEYLYTPAVPHQGCPMEWRIWFEPTYSSTQRVSDIHYNLYTVDDKGVETGSLAQDIGRSDIYSSIGEDEETFLVKQAPPVAHYVLNVAGTGSDSAGVTDASQSGLINIDVKVAPPLTPVSLPGTASNATAGNTIPSVPEFPLSSLLIMTAVVGLSILFVRINPSLSNIKL